MRDTENRQGVRDKEWSRRKILSVSMKHFARHGFSGARVERIAEDAGVNKRLIYYYFTDKEKLYLQVLDYAYGELRANSVEGNQNPDVQLRELLSSFMRSLMEHRIVFQLVSADLTKGKISNRAKKTLLYSEIDRAVNARNQSGKAPVDADALYVSAVKMAGIDLLTKKASEASSDEGRLMLAADFLIAAAT